MILTLPPSAFFVLLVTLPLLFISLLAILYTLRTIHRPHHEKENIYICTECGHIYALQRNRPMDRCPRCNHLNDAVRT